jgi:hypothetical protein
MDNENRCAAHDISLVPDELVCSRCGTTWPLGTPATDALLWQRLEELSRDFDRALAALERTESALHDLGMRQCLQCDEWHPLADRRRGVQLAQGYACTSCLPPVWASLIRARMAHRDEQELLANRRKLVRWALHSQPPRTTSEAIERLPVRGAWDALTQVDPVLAAMMLQARRTDGASLSPSAEPPPAQA